MSTPSVEASECPQGHTLRAQKPEPRRVLLIACGALVREVRAVVDQLCAGGAPLVLDVDYLPAPLHNRPERIVPAVRELVEAKRADYDHIALGYADCGTGGALASLAAELGLAMLPGAHCYEFFAGSSVFDALHDAEPGTFYLTDFLARNFNALILGGLGIDRHPELLELYFGNYRRVVLLAQTDDPALVELGQAAADRLGLAFEHVPTGLAPFTDLLQTAVGSAVPQTALDSDLLAIDRRVPVGLR